MKRLLYVLTTACLFLSVCVGCKEKDEEPEEIPTNLSINKTSFSVDALESKESFVVLSNKDWSIATQSSWLTFAPASGKADSQISVEMTVSANPETEERSAVATVTADDKTVQIEILQSAKEEIIIDIPGIEIADEKFMQYIAEHFDLNGDGKITEDEAEAVTLIDCSGKAIESLAGLEHFVNLETLICDDNLLTALDISKNTLLVNVSCNNNAIQSLDFSENTRLKALSCQSNQLAELVIAHVAEPRSLDDGAVALSAGEADEPCALETLNCSNNKLTVLDLSNSAKLIALDCSNNRLTGLNVSNCGALTTLDCTNNQLADLNVSGDAALATLDCSNNQLKALDVIGCDALAALDCSDNQLAALNVSGCDALAALDCTKNQLAGLDVSGGGALTTLDCSSNQLKTLDASNCTSLTTLDCSDNKLTDLNVSGNTALSTLDCSSNLLAGLNVSDNAALSTLDCSDNKLTALDVSANAALKVLDCSSNGLTLLDVSGNDLLEKLNCLNNELLTKILLDEGQTIPDLKYDSENTQIKYPAPPPPDKVLVNIPDASFKAYLVANFDKDKDGEISEDEALAIIEIRSNRMEIATMTGIECFPNLEVLYCNGNKLTSLNLTGNLKLKELSCAENDFSSLDLSHNVLLSRLYVNMCKLTNLDVKANTELAVINCSENNLNALDVTRNVKLETLLCQRNYLISLDLRLNRVLSRLNCTGNANLLTVILEQGQRIAYLDIAPPTTIVYATYLEFKDPAFLAYLLANFDADGDGRITEAEVKNITVMDCSNLGIESLDNLNLFTNLTSLTCTGNKLTSINLTTLTKLVTLNCDNNKLANLNISQNTALVTLDCSHNELSSVTTSTNKELKTLICNDNKIISLGLSQNTKLETLLCQNNALIAFIELVNNLSISTLNCKGNPQLQRIYLQGGQEIENIIYDENITSIRYRDPGGVTSITIDDSQFADYLLKNFDKDGNGLLSIEEALAVRTINCSGLGIVSLGGIEYFTNLTSLNCSDNLLTYLPISGLTALELLDCSDNQIGALDLTPLVNLKNLNCRRNQLTTLNIMRNHELTTLDCQGNQLTTLNIRQNSKIRTVICFDNAPVFVVYRSSSQSSVSISSNVTVITTDVQGVHIDDPIFEDYLIVNFDTNHDGTLDQSEQDAITSINCSSMKITSLVGIKAFKNLNELHCGDNNLTSLDLDDLAYLEQVYCFDNKLTSIKVDNCTRLGVLYCPGNLLTSLDVSGNANLRVLDCTENPRLQTVYLSTSNHSADMVAKDDHTTIAFK